MAKFNVAEAKSRFSELVQKAMIGEEVIIAKDNKPVVKLVPLMVPGKARAGRREVRVATAGTRMTATASQMTAACRSTRPNATDNRPALSG